MLWCSATSLCELDGTHARHRWERQSVGVRSTVECLFTQPHMHPNKAPYMQDNMSAAMPKVTYLDPYAHVCM